MDDLTAQLSRALGEIDARKAEAERFKLERDQAVVSFTEAADTVQRLTARAGAAEQERDQLRSRLTEEQGAYRQADGEWRAAKTKLAAAEQREAEKDTLIREFVTKAVENEGAWCELCNHRTSTIDHQRGCFVARFLAALASPSTPSPAKVMVGPGEGETVWTWPGTVPGPVRRVTNALEPNDWSVSVSRQGENVVTIEPRMLSGRTLSANDAAAVRAAGRQLLAFIGVENPEPFIVVEPSTPSPAPCQHEFDSESASPYRCTRQCGYEMPHRSTPSPAPSPTQEPT